MNRCSFFFRLSVLLLTIDAAAPLSVLYLRVIMFSPNTMYLATFRPAETTAFDMPTVSLTRPLLNSEGHTDAGFIQIRSGP